MDFLITDTIREQDEKTIVKGILDYNKAWFDKAACKQLGVFLENGKGEKTAGLIGYTHGEWLHIKWLWVSPEKRGQAVGSSLLRRAEQAARQRGCKNSLLDTFEFQAPEFYKKYGYRELFVLQEHPSTGKHYYLTKALSEDSAPV